MEKMSDNETVTVLTEFVEKYIRIENEQKLLAEDRKQLIADFKDRLDVKAVQAGMRIVKMRARLEISDEELDNMLLALERKMSV